MSEKLEPEIDALEIPKAFEPKEGDHAEIEATKLLSLPAADAKAISTTLKKLGLKKVTAKQVSELTSLGVMFPPATILKLATGGSVVTEVGLLHAYAEVMRIFDASNDKSKLKIVSQVGFLAKTLTANQKAMQDNARKNLPRAVETQNVKAHRFPSLQVVFQNSAGTTIVKTPEKVIDLEASGG